MSDPRPRPQYGEYATPEQQRAARGLPSEPLPPLPDTLVPAAAPAKEPATASTPRPRRADRIVTFALLAYGLLTVIMSGTSYLNLAPTLNDALSMVGVEGQFSNFAAARTWGVIATIALVVGWTLTAVLSVRRLRAGKITWWLPIVGAVVTVTLVSICIMVPLVGDPAFIEHVRQLSTP